MAVTWKSDPDAARNLRMDSSRDMHRLAGLLGYSCSPKQSAIDRRYFAEINANFVRPDGSYSHTRFNVAMGTGDTSTEAAADGYLQVLGHDSRMAALCLLARAEVLLPKARAHVEAIRRLENTLAEIPELLAKLRAAPVDEDDDL